MIPRKLILHNAIGIKKGIGKDEIEIDFTQFNQGVVGIFGKTGSGKTTILENMTPYRKMATRAGSLYDHFYDQGLKEFEFQVSGNIYKSHIIIDCYKKKMIATLFKNGDPVSDGLDSYDEKVEELLGDFDLFINSVFNPQSSISIVDMKDADRKDLFKNLFNITIYDKKYLPYVKNKVQVMDGRITTAKTVQEELQKDVDEMLGIRYDLEELKKDIPKLKEEVDHSNKELASHINKTNTLNKDITKAESEDDFIINMKEELNRLYLDDGRIAKENSDQAKEIEDMVSSNNKDILDTKEAIAFQESEITKGEKLINNKQDILDKHKEMTDLESRITEAAAKRTQLIEAEGNLRVLNNEVWRDEKDSKIIRDEEVPCIGSNFEKTCPLLSGARKALDGLDEKKKERDALEKKVKVMQKKYNISNAVETLEKLKKDGWHRAKFQLDEYEKIRDSITSKFENNRKHLKKCYEISHGLDDKLKKLEKKTSEQINSNKSREKELEKKLEERRKESNVEDMIKELRNLENIKEKMENAVNLARHNLSTVQSKIEEYSKQVSMLDRKEKMVADKDIEINKWFNHLEDWKIVDKACKEIPIFMLENLALVITDKANELLKDRLNNDITLRIVTTLPKAKKGFKEVFKIVVFSDGDEVLASYLSGGQKAIVDAALRMAIESSLSETSSTRYDSLFWDESDKAWDASVLMNFYDMLQTAHEWGNKQYTFLISHRSHIQANVDQKIIVENL